MSEFNPQALPLIIGLLIFSAIAFVFRDALGKLGYRQLSGGDRSKENQRSKWWSRAPLIPALFGIILAIIAVFTSNELF